MNCVQLLFFPIDTFLSIFTFWLNVFSDPVHVHLPPATTSSFVISIPECPSDIFSLILFMENHLFLFAVDNVKLFDMFNLFVSIEPEEILPDD